MICCVIWIIHCSVGLKCFFHLPKCLLLLLVFSFIYISKVSVETHLRGGGTYNNHIIASCPQSMPAKAWNFENRSVIGEEINGSKVPRFLWPMV